MKECSGLLDVIEQGTLVAVHIGFGEDRTVRSGQIRSYDFDTATLMLNTDCEVYIIPLNSVSAIKVIDKRQSLQLF